MAFLDDRSIRVQFSIFRSLIFYISLPSHRKDSSCPRMAEQIQILQRRLEDNFPRQKHLCRGDVVPTHYPFVCYVSVVLPLLFAQCVSSIVCVSLFLLLIPPPFLLYRPGQADLFLFFVLGCALRMFLRPGCF